MNKLTKYSLYSVGTVVVLIVGAAIYISATFDANSLKPKIESWVKTEKQRTLKFNGPISLSLFPKPGLTLSDVSLSEQNSDALFVHVSDARVTMQLRPLLSKRVVINEIDVQGADINLIKNKTGQYNFSDLTTAPTKTEDKPSSDTSVSSGSGAVSADPDFKLSQFNIAKSSISYLDQQSGQQLKLSDLSLFGDEITAKSAGHIDFNTHLKSTSPSAELQINTKVDRLNVDKKTGALLLEGFYNVIDGSSGKETVKLTLTVPKLNLTEKNANADAIGLTAQLNGPARKLNTDLKLDGISGDSQQVNVKALKLSLDASQADQALKLTVNSPMNANINAQTINLDQLAIRGDISSGAMKAEAMDLSGKLNADLRAQSVNTVMKGSLDHNTFNLNAAVKGFHSPYIRFDISAPSLDLNRYVATSQSTTDSSKNSNAAVGSNNTAKVDLSALNALNMDGQIKVGQLKYTNIEAQNFLLAFSAKNGLITVPQFSLNAFGGNIAASGSATTTTSPRINVKPNIAGVDIYALLKQFAGFDKIEGRATLNGNLAMQGGDTTALKNSLTGNLNTRVTDGAWRGINIAKTIRDAKAALSGLKGGEQAVTSTTVEKTDFTELTASILFNQGVATNKDLTMKSPLLRVSGEGEVDLKADAIDYLLKAALVNTSKGQEGKTRDQLTGVTLPIRIKGPVSAPKYSLDLTAALKENAGAKLDEKKQEIQQQVQQKAGDALSKGLKKLF